MNLIPLLWIPFWLLVALALHLCPGHDATVIEIGDRWAVVGDE